MYFEEELNIKRHFKRRIGLLLTWLNKVKTGVNGLPGAAEDAGDLLQSLLLTAWHFLVAPLWVLPPRSLLHSHWLGRCSSPPSQILAS